MAAIDVLEASLLADPDDAGTWSVYIDALVAAGDPRGELAAIQERRAATDTEELVRAETALLARHGGELLGMVDRLAPVARAGYELGWSRGHLRSLAIDEPNTAKPWIADVVRDLLARPIARFLTRFTLAPPHHRGRYAASARRDLRSIDVVDALAEAPRPALRELVFGRPEIPFDLEGEDDARDAVSRAGERLGKLARLWPATPALRSLVLSGGHFELDGLALPALRHLEVRQASIRTSEVEALCAAQLPQLESLVVWLGADDHGEAGYHAGTLAPLCDPAKFPALRHLGLVCSTGTAEIVAMLRSSKILPQLASLDLAGGTLADAAPLADAAFAHLRSIDLRYNGIRGDGQAPANARVDAQRFAPEVPRFNACME